MRMGFTQDFYIPIIKLPDNGEETDEKTIVEIKEKEYYVYKVEKWGESLDNIRRKGEMYYSGIFDQVMIWLKDTLRELHEKKFLYGNTEMFLTHGDILNEYGVNWGNILVKQNNYKNPITGDLTTNFEFKLIDFGNEMTSHEKEKEIYKELFSTNETKTDKYKMLENKVRTEENRKYDKSKRQRIIDIADDTVDYDYEDAELIELENKNPWDFITPLPPIFGSPTKSPSAVKSFSRLFGTPSPSPPLRSPNFETPPPPLRSSPYFHSPPPLSSSLRTSTTSQSITPLSPLFSRRSLTPPPPPLNFPPTPPRRS